MNRMKRTRAVSLTLLGMILIVVSVIMGDSIAAQGVSITLTATPSDVVVNTPTIVTFQATIPPDPNLITASPNLLRLVGGAWTNVGRMYDDGTHGDATPGDNIYTAQTEVNELQLGAVSFRASVAYLKQLLRVFSNTINVNVVQIGNTRPVANAGPDQTVSVGATVQLNGSGSSDADGDPLTFSWSFVSRPAGSNAVLSNPGAVTPTFFADQIGDYVLQLIVNDGNLNSVPDTVTITTTNSRPGIRLHRGSRGITGDGQTQ
ncbi:MAG: PKD domain-containing protein [Pyrinomonadaceae bacterium]|nr:PKD domain-containing protein [Pyrinomonadaceae bacterium]